MKSFARSLVRPAACAGLSLLCSLGFAQRSSRTTATGPTASITSVNSPVCAGDALKVLYRVSAPFGASNQFTVEMSDAAGSFAAPTSLRTFSANRSGVVSAPVPASTAGGSGYRIRLASTNPSTNSADNGSDITINPMPTVNPVPNQTFCAGNQMQTVFTGTANLYAWTTDPNSVGIATSASTTGATNINLSNNTGLVQNVYMHVTAVSLAGCGSKAMGFRIVVNPRPLINPLPPVIACRGTLVFPQFITGNVPGTVYAWNAPTAPSVGLALTSGVNVIPPFLTINNRPPGQISSAEFSILATSPQGCTNASVFNVLVNDCGTQHIDTDGGGATARSAGSFDAQVVVGPNPAHGNVRVSWTNTSTPLTVEVRDARGNAVIRPRTVSGNGITLDVSGLYSGTYYVQLYNAATGERTQKKLIKL